MKTWKIPAVFILLMLHFGILAVASDGRDLIVQKELDCVDAQTAGSNSISWNDVCDIPESSSAEQMQAVNQQLDQVEKNLPAKNITQPAVIEHQSKASESTTTSPNPQEHPRERHFDIAFQTDNFDYQTGNNWPYYYSQLPFLTDSNKVTKKGSLYGLYASSSLKGPLYTFWSKPDLPNFGKLEIELSKGSSDYSSYFTGTLDDFRAWKFDGRALIGYDYALNASTDLAFFTGLGYLRYSNNTGGWVDLPVFQYGPYIIPLGYEPFTIITTMLYVPIGVETSHDINDDWKIDFKMEGDLVPWGQVNYSLNDIPGSFSGTVVTTGQPVTVSLEQSHSALRGGEGFRTSLKLIKKYKLFNIFVEPYFKFLHLNETKHEVIHALSTSGEQYISVNSYLYDPKSDTIDIGTRLGVEF